MTKSFREPSSRRIMSSWQILVGEEVFLPPFEGGSFRGQVLKRPQAFSTRVLKDIPVVLAYIDESVGSLVRNAPGSAERL